jgi:hypothetical protein
MAVSQPLVGVTSARTALSGRDRRCVWARWMTVTNAREAGLPFRLTTLLRCCTYVNNWTSHIVHRRAAYSVQNANKAINFRCIFRTQPMHSLYLKPVNFQSEIPRREIPAADQRISGENGEITKGHTRGAQLEFLSLPTCRMCLARVGYRCGVRTRGHAARQGQVSPRSCSGFLAPERALCW